MRPQSTPELTPKDVARFWRYVRKSDGCWLFSGTPSQRYGQFGLGGKLYLAHRIAYQIAVGEIPIGLHVLHHCDVMKCVRPDHLYAGTHADNMRDKTARGRAPRGEQHPARRHPERLARGQRHGAYTKPESRVTGDRNGRRLHPEIYAIGAAHKRAKLTDDEVREIRRRYAAGGVFQRQLAAEFGVDQTLISHIVHGKTWKHVT